MSEGVNCEETYIINLNNKKSYLTVDRLAGSLKQEQIWFCIRQVPV